MDFYGSGYCPVACSSECDNELSVSAKSAGTVVPVQDMKACEEMELKLHEFLTPVLDEAASFSTYPLCPLGRTSPTY